MDEVKSLLESLWDSLFAVFPAPITIFLISLVGILLALAVYRLIVG